jgi:hypothetical protein
VIYMTDVQAIVTDLLEAIDGLVDWTKIPKDVRIRKYSIYAKRVAAVSRSVKNLDAFVENLLRDVAGDQLFVSREKANILLERLKSAEKNEKDVLDYLKRYPYLSVVLLGSKRHEETGEVSN